MSLKDSDILNQVEQYLRPHFEVLSYWIDNTRCSFTLYWYQKDTHITFSYYNPFKEGNIYFSSQCNLFDFELQYIVKLLDGVRLICNGIKEVEDAKN